MRRVGLFGGSFDPVHNAHLALAQEALRSLQLDELLWVPAGQPWQKTRRLADADDRAAMVNLAIQGEPRFRLERCELLRQGPSYTLQTLRELQAHLPPAQWFLLIGQDQYAGLHTWSGWRELLALSTLAVANRPGQLAQVDDEVLRTPHQSLALTMMDISSTQVRSLLTQGRDIAHLVPPAVASYIEAHGLYQPEGGGHPR